MRIEPSASGSKLDAIRPSTNKSTGSKSGEVTLTTTGTDSFEPTNTLSTFLSVVQSEPEIRLDRVQEVAERLAAGYYDTPAAAAETAESILGAIEQK